MFILVKKITHESKQEGKKKNKKQQASVRSGHPTQQRSILKVSRTRWNKKRK